MVREATARVLRLDRHPALGLHQRGPHNRPCFNHPEPDEEGPMGSGAAPKPAGLVEAVKAIPDLGFMQGPFVALAERVENALTAALAGKASPEDVSKAVSEAVGALKTELTRALKSISDSAAQRMGVVEEKVGAVEKTVGDAASAAASAQSTADGKVDQKAVDSAVGALEQRLTELLAGKASSDDVSKAVSEAVGALKTELADTVQALRGEVQSLREALAQRPTKEEAAAAGEAAARRVLQEALGNMAKLVAPETRSG